MKTIEEQLSEANARAEGLQKDLTASQQLAEETQGKLSAAEKRATDAEASAKEAREALATAQTENTSLTEKVTKLEGEAKTAEDRAQEIVASLGHKPVQGKAGGEPTGGVSVAEQFAAITDPVAKSKFWNKHRDELAAERNK